MGFYMGRIIWLLLALVQDPCPLGVPEILLMVEILHDLIYISNIPKV